MSKPRKQRQHKKKGKPEYQKQYKESERIGLSYHDHKTMELLTAIKSNTDDLVFRENVGSFKEAYANGKKDALSTSAGWVIDVKKYLDMITIDDNLDTNFIRFKEVFTRRFEESFVLVISDSVGKKFDFETMESVDIIPTRDASLSGTVAETFDTGYYVCEEVVVRKQSVSTYSLEEFE